MGALSISVQQAGRPLLMANVRSVTFGPRADVDPKAITIERSQAARSAPAPLKPTAPEKGSGVGETAQRSLVLSNIEDTSGASEAGAAPELTEQEQELVDKLRSRDREVRAHEEAHAAVGGSHAGSPSYSYQTGPDGRNYAIGGEVPIDVSPVSGDPEATIEKMRIVKAAALAPAEPSSTDRRVAALAEAHKLQAMADLTAQRTEARSEGGNSLRSLADVSLLLGRGEDAEPGGLLSRAA